MVTVSTYQKIQISRDAAAGGGAYGFLWEQRPIASTFALTRIARICYKNALISFQIWHHVTPNCNKNMFKKHGRL